MKADITTVIPTYRRPRLLQRAIASTVEQEGVDVRVAVFDNCSGDETAEVVAALARMHPQVHYHCHPRNLGALANFEFGMRSVDTPFFSILSDDDYLLPGFYQSALAGLAAHPEAMFWVGVTLNVDEHNTIWDARVDRWPGSALYAPPGGALAMTGGTAPAWTGIVFRREVLDMAGFIDPETQGPADLDYTLRLGARFPYLFEKRPVAVFTINSESISSTQPLSSFWPGWLKMFDNIGRLDTLADADRAALLAALRRDARRMLFRRGVNALAGHRLEFARDAAAALADFDSGRLGSNLLRSLAWACDTVPGAQHAFAWGYRRLEREIINSRSVLRERYAHLLRPG